MEKDHLLTGHHDPSWSPVYEERANKGKARKLLTLGALTTVSFAFLSSLTLNIMLLMKSPRITDQWQTHKTSPAALDAVVTAPFGAPDPYGHSHDLNETDALWLSISTETGMVALPKSTALHPTETFPWDQSKGVYMLNGYHGLHCLALIYTSLRQYQQSIPQTQPFEHVVHCLGALRSDVLCAADDTPRFAGDPDPNDTFRQQRQCRDWNALETWARANSACFKRFGLDDPRYGTIEEWTSCPDGSPYTEAVREYHGQRVIPSK